jgi:hypothetical protein
MINVLKEFWFKWRGAVLLAKVEAAGYKRLALKDKQIEMRKKSEEYFAKAKEIRRSSKQA